MKLLCGLGNPGEKYESTRHNAGFMFIDAFATRHEFPPFKEKWGALFAEMGVGEDRVILLKPLSFMNLSGQVLAKFVNFYKLDLSDLILIYDDVDLKLGDIRYKDSGGSGTHNGMKSVQEHLGGQNFPRLRLGIESRGLSSPEEMPLDAFVLSSFSEEERLVFKQSVAEGIEIIEKTLAK